MDSRIAVTVFCLTYNHEKYIEKCLDGFIMQKTKFDFEVLVHDDASTDNTASIIRKYSEKYPNIIKPIFQNVNQYSKGVRIIRHILLPLAKGEFLAWCEGDDYWTDENKLQKQFDFLTNNREYSLCVHRTRFKYLRYNYDRIVPEKLYGVDWDIEDIIEYGGGCFATNSLMIRNSVFSEQPDSFRVKGFGDYQIFVYGALRGKCYCLPDIMSVYNHGTENSYSERIVKNRNNQIDSFKQFIELLKTIDDFTEHKYYNVIDNKIKILECDMYIMQGQKKYSKIEPYKSIWKSRKIKYYLRMIKDKFPFLVKVKYGFKNIAKEVD